MKFDDLLFAVYWTQFILVIIIITAIHTILLSKCSILITFKCIKNASLSETIDDYFRLLREGVQCSYEPVSTLRLQNGCTRVNLYI